jgi:hypothetical protein
MENLLTNSFFRANVQIGDLDINPIKEIYTPPSGSLTSKYDISTYF